MAGADPEELDTPIDLIDLLVTPRVVLRTSFIALVTLVTALVTHAPALTFLLGWVTVHALMHELDRPRAQRGGRRNDFSLGLAAAFAVIGALGWAAALLAESSVGEQAGPAIACILLMWTSTLRGWARARTSS